MKFYIFSILAPKILAQPHFSIKGKLEATHAYRTSIVYLLEILEKIGGINLKVYEKKMKNILYITSLIAWIVFIYYIEKNKDERSKELSIKFAKEIYIPKGVVTEKRIDNSFGMRGANILVIDYSKYKVISKIFNIIHVGDTIQKDKNSMLIFINNKEYNYLNP